MNIRETSVGHTDTLQRTLRIKYQAEKWNHNPYERLNSFRGYSDPFKLCTPWTKLQEQGLWFDITSQTLRCHRCIGKFSQNIYGQLLGNHSSDCSYLYETDQTRHLLRVDRDVTNTTIKQRIDKKSQKCVFNEIPNKKEKDSDQKCVRCRKDYRSILFTQCYHLVTCSDCSHCIDYCPECDMRILNRVNIEDPNTKQCYRCNEKSNIVFICSFDSTILCEPCSYCIDYCPKCNSKIEERCSLPK